MPSSADHVPPEYFNEADVCLFRLKDYERAAAAFSLAIERNAQNPTYYANRGDTRLQLEQYRDALADLNEAIRLHGDDAWYYALLPLGCRSQPSTAA
jgi:tetratricopeptide (TPR) repeat protein